MKKIRSNKISWLILVLGSGTGLVASFLQTIERINYAKNPTVPLSCNLNAIFSCSKVFDAWQSSVFGFSNSIMCLAFFSVLLGAGLAGLFGSTLHKYLRLTLHFFSLFFLGFGAWYLWQSTFYIGYICIFCVFCYAGVIAINWSWLRINQNDLPISNNKKAWLSHFIDKGGDTFVWFLWAIFIATVIFFHFW